MICRGGLTGERREMTLPNFSMRQLLEAGVHFGHQKQRWNPKMTSYLFGERNGIHIIDLNKTVAMIEDAAAAMEKDLKALSRKF